MKDKSSEIILFAFGVLFAIIGYLMIDKLSAINNNMTEIKTELKEVRVENIRQDKELLRHEQLLNEGEMAR